MDLQRQNKLSIPGQCNILSVVLKSYNGMEIDIRNHLLEIVIHESFDNACLSGYIQVLDNLNFVRNIPLIGNETLHLQFATPSRPEPIDQTFFCYKVDSRIESESNKGMAVYKIYFVSQEFVNASKKKISLSFSNKKYSEMVSSLYLQYCKIKKPLIVQETSAKKHLVIPFMKPFDAIDMICRKSISKDLQDVSYIFYESFDAFNFCTINKFAVGVRPVVRYTWYRQGMSPSGGGSAYRDIQEDFYRIESYDIVAINNTMNNIKNGLFGSYLLIHDSTFKTVTSNTFSYNNDFYKINTIYNEGILPRNQDQFSKFNMAHYRMYPRQSYAFDDVEVNDDYDKNVLLRNAHLAHLENSRINILVAGDSNRRVGELVEARIPSIEPGGKNDDIYDPYLSGYYMITQITHMISKSQYKMRLFLERDSMPVAYPENKNTEVQE